MRKLLTFNTVGGLCSMGVDLYDLQNRAAELVPIRKKSAMSGVPHFEMEIKKLKKTKSEPVFQHRRFGFTGNAYRKSFEGDSKIPVATNRKVLRPQKVLQRSKTLDSTFLYTLMEFTIVRRHSCGSTEHAESTAQSLRSWKSVESLKPPRPEKEAR